MSDHTTRSRAAIVQAVIDLGHDPADVFDVGSGHAYTKEIVQGVWVGLWEWHFDLKGKPCTGIAYFDTPEADELAGRSGAPGRWHVESWEPLTLSPSLFCDPTGRKCASHGFIREGRWV